MKTERGLWDLSSADRIPGAFFLVFWGAPPGLCTRHLPAAGPRPMTGDAPTRLARRLGTMDAVVVGLGAMIGAGVFAAFAPAARAAGNGLLLGLLIAAFVAYCNATSSAELAAVYPESGGAYVYGRKRLGAFWGFVAGWGFVIGKLASCAAMAMTFGSYAAPSVARPLAVAAVIGFTVLISLGGKRAVAVRGFVGAAAPAARGVWVVAGWSGGPAAVARPAPVRGIGLHGVLRGAGFFFSGKSIGLTSSHMS